MAFRPLLGDFVVDSAGTPLDVDVLAGKYLFLYFSANWPEPCRVLTATLKAFHTEHAVSKNFEIVLVSLDQDDASFREHCRDIPWKAVPYADKHTRDKLFRKFGAGVIPCLTLVAPDGKTITKKGWEAVTDDLKATSFPWYPRPLKEVVGTWFESQRGRKRVEAQELHGKYLGVYFFAPSSPECRSFTPILTSVYRKLEAEGKKFEVVCVNLEDDSDDGMDEMPWLAVPSDDVHRRCALNDALDAGSPPCLAIVDPEFKVLNSNAVAAVRDDVDGARFPWPRTLVIDTADAEDCTVLGVNPCVVLLAAKAPESDRPMLRRALQALATQYAAAQGGTGGVTFIFASDVYIDGFVRDYAKVDPATPTALVFVYMLDCLKKVAPPELDVKTDITAMCEWVQSVLD